MLYHDYVIKAIEATVITDENSRVAYLDPNYKWILEAEDLSDTSEISDFRMSIDDVYEMLKLEVKRRNAQFDHSRNVAEWIDAVINNAIDPMLTDTDNELMKNIIEYMKYNDKLNDKAIELTKKAETLEKKSEIRQAVAEGINLSKRKDTEL